MNWIASSLLMFISSTILYLLVRKSQIKDIANTVNNFYTFFIPSIIFLFIVIIEQVDFFLPLHIILIIILTAFFLSYLGNVCSLRSIKSAPNPGYSLILSKSYVVYTTLISVLLFKSEIQMKSIIAISLIIGFSTLIILSKTKYKQTNGSKWVLFAFGSFFAWGTLALVSKYLFTQNVNVFLYLFYLHIFVSTFIYIESRIRNFTLKVKRSNYLLLVFIGLANMFFNIFLQYGIKNAPNPGYINAVNASSISAVALLSSYFYKDELSAKKLIGIFGVTLGLFLLFI
jgi:drug/metabolite transporter (DMT)-like permease